MAKTVTAGRVVSKSGCALSETDLDRLAEKADEGLDLYAQDR
jgi:hypothetical protein